MQKMTVFLAALFILAPVSFANSCKERKVNRVSTDVKAYRLCDGTLSQKFGANTWCTVTTRVQSFKVSGHPNDAAIAYYKRDGDLFVAHKQKWNGYSCPSTSKNEILPNVTKYTVVSSTKMENLVVNMALSSNGNFRAWDNTRVVISLSGIKKYVNNECFGVEGASYSTYVAFAITYAGKVYKVKGKSSSSVLTDESYADLTAFKNKEKVCK